MFLPHGAKGNHAKQKGQCDEHPAGKGGNSLLHIGAVDQGAAEDGNLGRTSPNGAAGRHQSDAQTDGFLLKFIMDLFPQSM